MLLFPGGNFILEQILKIKLISNRILLLYLIIKEFCKQFLSKLISKSFKTCSGRSSIKFPKVQAAFNIKLIFLYNLNNLKD